MSKHKHKWEPLREGYPQKLCWCGAMKVQEIHAGTRTVSLGSTVATFSGSTAPVVSGDMTVIDTRLRSLTSADDLGARNVDEPSPLRIWQIAADPEGTGTLIGGPVIVQSGISATVTEEGFGQILSTSHGQYKRYRTAGGAPPQDAGIRSTSFTQTRPFFNPVFTCAFSSDLLSTPTRFWIGLTSADSMGANDGAGLNIAAIHFLTGTSASWNAVTNDGSGTGTITASGFPFSAGSGIVITIQVTTSAVRFTFRTGTGGNPTTVSHTTQLPTLAGDLGFIAQARQLGAAVAGFGFRMVNLGQGDVID